MAADLELELVFQVVSDYLPVSCQPWQRHALQARFMFWLLETKLIRGFFFRATRSGGQLPITFSRSSSFNHQASSVSGRLRFEASKWTYPTGFFLQSRFYLDIPQVSHLPSIGPFFFSLPTLLLLLERRFLMLGFFVTGTGCSDT